jgi:hypothetical protein
MKLTEIRLYDVKVIKYNETIYEGPAENVPEDLKTIDITNFKINNGKIEATIC